MKRWLAISLPFIVLVAVTVFLQYAVLTDPQRVADWLSSYGGYALVAYVIIQGLTIIIAPLGGGFVQIAMLALFGNQTGLFAIYLTTNVFYCVNFYLSKKFGRRLVEKMIGKKGLTNLDHLAADAGVGSVWLLRILQPGYYDYVSYAAGLTKLDWTNFILATFLGGIPGVLLSYFILREANNLVYGIIGLQVTSLVLIAVYFAIRHYTHTTKRR